MSHEIRANPDEPKYRLDDPATVAGYFKAFYVACVLSVVAGVVLWVIGYGHHEPGHHDAKHEVEQVVEGAAAEMPAEYVDAMHHGFDSVPFVYSVYGFLAIVLLVVLAKALRKVVRRDEDYYD